MGRVEAIIGVALAISMAGCAAKKPKNPALLATPPVPAAPSNLKPEPLSIPQTQVQLPPFQPLNPDALTAVQPPEPAAPAAPPAAAPKPVRRTTGAPPKPKPDVTPPPAEPAPPAEPERPPIQEIIPADERKHEQESGDGHKREIRQLLAQARAHRLTSEQNKMVKRIQAFVTQSDDAEKRGDMREADALAERGLVLARELAGGK